MNGARLSVAMLLFASAAWAQEVSKLDISRLEPNGYVSDFADVLSADAVSEIEQDLTRVEHSSGAEIAVVLVPSLEGDTIENAARRLFNKWGIGKKGKNNGVLLLLAIHDHKNRIQVGNGLQSVITSTHAGEILRSIRPLLREANYSEAIRSAIRQIKESMGAPDDAPDEIGAAVAPSAPFGDSVPQVPYSPPDDGLPIGGILIGVVIVLLIAVAVAIRFAARGGSPRRPYLGGPRQGGYWGRGGYGPGWGGGGWIDNDVSGAHLTGTNTGNRSPSGSNVSNAGSGDSGGGFSGFGGGSSDSGGSSGGSSDSGSSSGGSSDSGSFGGGSSDSGSSSGGSDSSGSSGSW